MARFGSGADGYELLVAGRRPRAKFVRRLTPDAALRRLQRISAASPTDTAKIRAELERAKVELRGKSFDDVLKAAVRDEKVHLYRRFALSPSGAGERDYAIPMAALLAPEPAPEPESPAPAEAAPEPAPAPPSDERAAELLADTLLEAANSGAALCHSCMDCAACRGA